VLRWAERLVSIYAPGEKKVVPTAGEVRIPLAVFGAHRNWKKSSKRSPGGGGKCSQCLCEKGKGVQTEVAASSEVTVGNGKTAKKERSGGQQGDTSLRSALSARASEKSKERDHDGINLTGGVP